MSVVERLDGFQRRHPAVAFPLGVAYKFFDDRGPHLAALITYYGVVSLFPLLLLLTAVLGFVLHDNPGLQREVLDSALSSFPLRGQIESNIGDFHGSGAALVIGVVGTLYGGLGAMQAAQAAFNRIYAVPRFAQPNPFLSRLRSLLLVLALGLGALVATGLSAAAGHLPGLLPELGPFLPVVTLLTSFAVNTGIFLVAFQALTACRLGWRNVLIGALIAAGLWELLQWLGTAYLRHYVSHSDSVYGIFGIVLGLIVWIYLQALVVVLAAEINVVRDRRIYPRALLTPFTDDVDLTASDVRAYTSYARSERYKGFEQVQASFERPADDAPADGAPGGATASGVDPGGDGRVPDRRDDAAAAG